MKTTTRIVLAAGLAGVLLAPSAQAGTATDTFQVSLTLINSCTIVVADLNFGAAISTLASNIDVNTTATVTCTGIGAYTITMNAGSGTGSTILDRQMNSGANTIDYNLFTTAARTIIIGDGTVIVGTASIAGVSTGGADNQTIYGRVAGGQNPKPIGTYTSDVIATVTF